MKIEVQRVVCALLVGGVCVLSNAAAASAQAGDWAGKDKGLNGSWVVQVTQRNCQTGDPVAEPFLSLLTFSAGGTMVETTSNPMFFPSVRGPGHGVWHPTGGHTYRAVSTAFITANGELVKTQSITQSIEMGEDPDSFTTTKASVVLVPANPGPTITGCATSTGKRIE